jgi:hypothetical protein
MPKASNLPGTSREVDGMWANLFPTSEGFIAGSDIMPPSSRPPSNEFVLHELLLVAVPRLFVGGNVKLILIILQNTTKFS